jgi:hypothetical protein
MKLTTLTLCFILINGYHSNAQNNGIAIKAGQKVNEAVAPNVRFRYPEFVLGEVYFKDGTVSKAPLNFNRVLGEMQFIDSKNDTLSIDNEAMIKYIVANNDTFYYSKGYVELVASKPLVKLGKSEKLKIGDTRKIGGYNQSTSNSAITTISTMYTRSGVNTLDQRVDLLLVKETLYYIGDSYNHFLPVSKRNIMKLFGRQEASIEQYFRDNNVRFNNEDDLKKLIDYLQSIL